VQTRIGLGRFRIRIDDEENERLDGAAASLLEKPDLFHDGEETLEGAVAEIDDCNAVIIGDPANSASPTNAGSRSM
jgi:hypothetical protein